MLSIPGRSILAATSSRAATYIATLNPKNPQTLKTLKTAKTAKTAKTLETPFFWCPHSCTVPHVCLCSATAPGMYSMLIGRCLCGLGLGLCIPVMALYISEVSATWQQLLGTREVALTGGGVCHNMRKSRRLQQGMGFEV